MAKNFNTILVLNAGSSSIKFALYDQTSLNVLCRGVFESIGSHAKIEIKGELASHFNQTRQPNKSATHKELISWLLDEITTCLPDCLISAAGHRIVHGGQEFNAPALFDDDVFAKLQALTPLAPGHQPHNLASVTAIKQRWPDIAQVACFDTAFHRTMPKIAQTFALPHELSEQGIVRYGFHGSSYQYIADILPNIIGEKNANGRVIIAHLGHGASMCAMHNRKSVATTMGFTALDGLVMGKRCGDIDPGVLLFLCQQQGMTPAQVDKLLNKQSGLLGVSGISSDMRVLLKSDDSKAKDAIDLFAYRVNQKLGEMTASLGGIETLIFTAGIGTHSAPIRKMICDHAGWAGIELDEKANQNGDQTISAPNSKVRVLVLATDEEKVIARSTRALISHQ